MSLRLQVSRRSRRQPQQRQNGWPAGSAWSWMPSADSISSAGFSSRAPSDRASSCAAATNPCPGNDPATPPNSPQPASAEGFAASAQPPPPPPPPPPAAGGVFRPPPPTLRTPASAPKSDRPGPGRPKKTPHVHPEPGTQQSRKPHDTQTKVSSQA